MKITAKIKASLLAVAVATSLAVMPDANAYPYTNDTLGIQVELAAEPAKSGANDHAAQMLYEKYGLVLKVFDQTQPQEELDAYLAQTDTEIKQQMSAYQKDMGVFLVDAYWVKDGNHPIMFAEAYNQQHYFATANVISSKRICTITRIAGDKMTDAERDEFLAVARSLAFTK